MSELPSGTVTFVFTDIEGSTQLWEKYPDDMRAALAQHDALLRDSIKVHHGHVIKTTGDGVHAVFEKSMDAIQAMLEVQHALQTITFGNNIKFPIRVRMGIHTGDAELREGDYYGQALNRTARIMSIGHGGQILLSALTMELAREYMPAGISFMDLGEHRLKDLIRPERIFQINAPNLPKEFPALRSLNTLPNNLPGQLTSFIGREREMKEASTLLASTHLLTLIGPGGTGKTRLSLQIAVEQFSNFKDGIWLVELASLTDPAFIVSTIASIFDLREVQGVPLVNILIDYLRAKNLLLILDNCEHLVEASAQIADQILHACPQLKILTSSREALGISGEAVYRVPSLLDNDAVRLFVERATKSDSRFNLTEHNAAYVGQICSRLDGIPLAIELAAARVKIFTPEQIAARLDDRFKLLTGGSRTALPRQQTLRALIDWSYQSLNETEQRVLRRLAVFSGGWTIEAAESVIGEAEALDGLMGLVNKSLVNVDEQGNEARYHFLETIRQYAMEKLLESGEAREARNHHLDYILQTAEDAEQKMFGAESQAWLDHMEVEHENLRAALEWSVSNDLPKALKLALAIGGFWTSRDYNSEARSWSHIILERSALLAGLENDRAKLYALLGWTSITIGSHKEGRAAAEAGMILARQGEDKRTLVRLLVIMGLSSLFLGDMETAVKAPEEALLIARQSGFKGELAMALTSHAQANYFVTRDIDLAKKYLDEATRLGDEVGFQWASSMSAYGAGRLAGNMGDIETARARLMESAEISMRFGNRRIVYSSHSELAHVLREHGILDEALKIYREVIPGWKELGHRAAIAHELECIAYILVRKEELERAATLLGAAKELRKVIDTNMTTMEAVEYEREVATLHELLGENEFSKQWGLGEKLTMDEAIDIANHD